MMCSKPWRRCGAGGDRECLLYGVGAKGPGTDETFVVNAMDNLLLSFYSRIGVCSCAALGETALVRQDVCSGITMLKAELRWRCTLSDAKSDVRPLQRRGAS